MNQQIPEILDTQNAQNNQQGVPCNPFGQQASSNFLGQSNQQFSQMQYPPIQFSNNILPQLPPQFPQSPNQFQFQPNQGFPQAVPPMMPRMNTPNANSMMFQFPQNNGFFPQPPMLQKNQVKNNDDEVQKLKEKVRDQEAEIQRLKNKLSTITEESNSLQQNYKNKDKENDELKGSLQKSKISFNDEIENRKQQLYIYQLRCEELEEKERKSAQANKKLQNEINILNDEYQQYKEKINQLHQVNNESSIKTLQQSKNLEDLRNEIDKLNDKVNSQNNEIQQKDQLIETLKKIQSDYIQNKSYNQDVSSTTDKATLIQLNKDLENNINILEHNYKELETKFQMLEIENKMHQDKAKFFEECTEEMRSKLEQNQKKNQNFENDETQQFIKEFQQRQQDTKNSQQDEMKKAKEKLLQKKQKEQQEQEQRNREGKQKMLQQIEKAGKIQCCFVMDLFKSNDKQAKAIIKAAQSCQKLIKINTNRHSVWGAVCYGYSKTGLQIKTQEFSQSSDDVSNFLTNQKLNQDQKDQPEDLKSALLAMLNLKWTEKYKLAILIPNSPCHGKIYHHPKKYSTWFGLFSVNYDTKPNDNLEDIIKELIKREIVLLVIRQNDETTIMCNQLQILYTKSNAAPLFYTLSVKDLGSKNSDQNLNQKIQHMVGHMIGTSNERTKTKINYQMRDQNFKEGLIDKRNLKEEVIIINKDLQQEFQKQGEQQKGNFPEASVQDAIEDKNTFEKEIEKNKDCQDGALQAICKKKGDIANFQTQVKCEDFNCKVYSVELKQASFDSKIQNIDKIRYEENDFDLKEQAQWQCVRTKNPFALGMMKKVYLMKKKNNTEEIYVVKIPIDKGTYNKLSDAVNDCRSHLIAKNMMKLFIEKLTSVNAKTPQVQYTQFLILEENQSKYWIAERFFEGEFKKYNNNDGYINDENNDLNAISQGFSFFTYQMSSFNYIINDIQGIKNYFTDPAINTVKGNFDETDVGEEGISNYLTIFQAKKDICEQLLNSIGIDID